MESGGSEPIPDVQAMEIETPLSDDAIEITDADLVPGAVPGAVPAFDGAFRRPGILTSILWCALLVATQLAVGVALVVVVMVSVLWQHQGPFNQVGLSHDVERAAEEWMLPLGSTSTVAVAFAVTYAMFRRQTSRCVGFRPISLLHLSLILMMAVPMSVLTSEFTNCVQHLFPRMQMLEIFADFAKQPLPLIFVAGCLFPGIGEELFFRGFLSRGLISRYGPSIGALVASFLFGAIHIHPVQASGAFMLGLVLQLVFLTTQSLWGAIVLHTANNALAFAAMIYGDRLPIPGFTTGSADTIIHTPLLLVLAAVTSAAMLLFVLYRTRMKWVQADGTTWSRGFVTAEGPIDPSINLMAGSFQVPDAIGMFVTYGIFIAALVGSVAS